MLAVSRLHGKLATGKHDSPKEKRSACALARQDTGLRLKNLYAL